MMSKRVIPLLGFVLVFLAVNFGMSMAQEEATAHPQAALGTGFTYQGQSSAVL